MAKFIIQDIVPPRRKKTAHVVNHKNTHSANTTKHLESKNEADHGKENLRAREHSSVPQDEPKVQQPTERADNTDREFTPIETISYIEPKTEPLISQRMSEAAQERVFIPPDIVMGTRVSDDTSGYKGWIKWIVATLIVSGVIFFVFQYFASATVTLTPKQEVVSVDAELNATKTATGTDLTFGVAKITLDDTITVPASGTKSVTEKASGQIVVYNEQTTSQRLIKNTRFQSTKGLIYRINESINVPKAVSSGGKVTPGTLTVTVYADEAGPTYNSEPTDFTVPGLKSGPAFKKVYARSKGPLTGGASGVIKVVSDTDLKTATEKLRVSLETKLRNKARSELLPDQIVYDDGIVVSLEKPALSNKENEGPDTAVVTQKGTIYLVVFNRELLTEAIAKNSIDKWSGEAVSIKNLEKLSLQFSQLSEKSLVNDGAIAFSVTGNAEFIWSIDSEAIKKALSGIKRSKFNELMATYPMVAGAKASINPKWKSSFPDDTERINIVIQNTGIAK